MLAKQTTLILLLLFTTCFGIPASADSKLSPFEQGENKLGKHLSVLEDVDGNLSLETVASSAYEDLFVKSTEKVLNFGYTESQMWLRVQIPATIESVPDAWLLEVGPPKPDDVVQVFVLSKDGKTVLTRDLKQFDKSHDWQTLQRGFVFELNRNQDLQVFIKLKSHRNFQVPVTLWQKDKFRFSELTNTVVLGIFYGVLIAMMIYNLFLFGVIRDLSYFYYVAYIASQLCFMFLFVDHLGYYYDGVTPLWGGAFISHVGNMLVMTSVLFCRQFLDLQQNSPWLNRFALGLIALSVLNAALIYFGADETFRLLIRFSIVLCNVLFLSAGLQGIWRRSPIAMIYLFSWTPFIVGGLVMLATVQGFLPANAATNYALQLGVLGEVMLLSIGLGYRVNLLQKQIEVAQQLSVDHLQRANEIKDEFLANVSHELRTPLYGILGLAEAALKQEQKQETQLNNNLKLILTSGQRLTRLVNDLLDFSAMNREAPKLQQSNVDPHTTAALIINLCQPLVDGTNLILENSIPESVARVYADEDRLQQILFNLISNAIKFTPSGSVVITASPADVTGWLLIQVRDTGIGITAQDQEDIFASFQQVNTEPRDKEKQQSWQYQGTGIGLAVTKQLVESHGGTISIQSQLGHGTCFEFSLPIADDQESKQQVLLNSRLALTPQIVEELTVPSIFKQANGIGDKDKNILVVDDEAINLAVFEQQLAEYQVTTAQNGQQALAHLATATPDLIIVDLMMPGMNGYELCQKIRQQVELKTTPIIIVTAKNRVEDLIQGFESGCNDYLTKPFFSEELNVRVHNQLQLHSMLSVQMENGRLQAQIEQYAKNELALRTPVERLQRLIDNLEDAVIAIEANGTILHLNQAALSTLQSDADVLLGNSLKCLIPSIELDTLAASPLNKLLENEAQSIDQAHFNVTLNTFQTLTNTTSTTSKLFSVQVLALQAKETILLMTIRDQAVTTDNSSLGKLVTAINLAYQQSFSMAELAKQIDQSLLQQNPGLAKGLSRIETEFQTLLSTPSKNDDSLGPQLYELLKLSLKYWELSTTKTKIELAIESKIWAITVDDGRLRVRTLDRYLNLKTFPKRPKWRDVVRTAYFVLSHHEGKDQATAEVQRAAKKEQRQSLEDVLETVLSCVNETL